MAEIILAEKIIKSYGEAPVLDGADFSLREGEFVALLGPSGSGKSTLLNLIGLLDSPDSGKIFLDGEDVVSAGEKRKAALRAAKIGFVFQFDSLLPEFTVLENADIPALMAGNPNPKLAAALLERFGLGQLSARLPCELSGGEKQRAAIARALRNSPRLILADEPTGNLDSANADKIFGDFKSLAETGVAVVMATHNAAACRYASRSVTVSGGKLTTQPV